MRQRNFAYLFIILLGAFIVAGSLLLLPGSRASAQCGSQASSCKNCHETQAQKPVNNDGKGWHTGHAFGDFCYACHGGNNQSMDKATAHTGMVAPLSDIKTACQSCHPNDLTDRAQKYATALGVTLGSSAGAAPAETPAATSAPAGGATTGGSTSGGTTSGGNTTASGAPAAAPAGSEIVDYSQQYDTSVLGKTQANLGNIILAVLIVLVALGGGAFVYFNERRLRGLTTTQSEANKAGQLATALPKVEGYNPEVTALLPLVARLNPMGLHALKRLLETENPDEASELLHSLSHLDPELVRRIRGLDRDTRSLLIALAGD